MGFDVDVYNSHIYVGVQHGRIYQFSTHLVPRFHGGMPVRVVVSNLPTLGKLAVDWINGKLLWTQGSNSSALFMVSVT